MPKHFHDDHLPWLKEAYFSDPQKRLLLKPGDILMKQGDVNDRLYLLLSGCLTGFFIPDGEPPYELFKVTPNMFVGVHSYFSRTYLSSVTVVTEEPSEAAFIEKDQKAVPNNQSQSLIEQFMPVVLANLLQRIQSEQMAAIEKEKALKKLIETEKLASLGQMAAGIAHELNNAISVLDRNTNWLKRAFVMVLQAHQEQYFPFFYHGLEHGRACSSREIRSMTSEYQEKYGLNVKQAKKLAEMGLSGGLLDEALKEPLTDLDGRNHYWQLGATFHDMNAASGLASHVVRSVKALAVQKTASAVNVNVNQTIREAMILLASPLRRIQTVLDLDDLPKITASSGELIQVWINLIRNSIDALAHSGQSERVIRIKSRPGKNVIVVSIEDNGPGIPAELISKIFQPNFTTKEKGLDFGLGLGLSIVTRIINDMEGEVSVKSVPGKTVFTVHIPIKV